MPTSDVRLALLLGECQVYSLPTVRTAHAVTADGVTGYGAGMTQQRDDQPEGQREHPEVGSVPDEALPEDLRPGPDNPLAEGLPAGETAEGLLDPDQSTHRTSSEPSEDSEDSEDR
jgi:hypothetical protein